MDESSKGFGAGVAKLPATSRESMFVYEDAYAAVEPGINAEGVYVFPFDTLFPIHMRFLEFGKNRAFRMHRHDYFELMYVHSGEVEIQVQDELLKLHKGDLFVMGSTLRHCMRSYRIGRLRTAVLYFLPDLIRERDHASEGSQYLMPFLVQDTGFPHVVPAATGIPAEIFDLMTRIGAELPATTNRGRLAVKTYLKMILVLLVNHFAEYQGGEGVHLRKEKELARLRPLFDFVDERYRGVITVQDAATVMHMSKSSFMRFFRQVTGQPFITYLNHFRIAKAEAALLSMHMTVAEVGQSVGFCDQSYFGLLFKALLHVTPGEYKRRMAEQRDGTPT
jgi:AraC-like DNA-binding protein/mannose-6-phosphate isomerase-like protein (cupin superfamily)